MPSSYFVGAKNRYKALYWDRDGFMLLYKRIENGNLQWPKDQDEVKYISSQFHLISFVNVRINP